MAASQVKFERWNALNSNTWSYNVFSKYNDELNELLWSYRAVFKQTFKNLQSNKAKLTDLPSQHLLLDVPKGEEVFKSITDWSKRFNEFNNWTNLNSLLTLTSNLETYISTVVSLAIESDPGILFESSKSIDGISLVKNGAKISKYQKDIITSITKGDWNSRISCYKSTFGVVPNYLEKNLGELEKIRNLRNKIGHAFGRDIEGSRNHEVKEIQQIEKLSDKNLKKIQYIIINSAKSIDEHLLKNHIGEYQRLLFYHKLFPSISPKQKHQSDRAVILKKELGKYGDISGKLFCKGLVKYYEEI